MQGISGIQLEMMLQYIYLSYKCVRKELDIFHNLHISTTRIQDKITIKLSQGNKK